MLSLKYSFLPDQSRSTLSAAYQAFEEIMRKVPLAELDLNADIFTVIKDLRSVFTMGTTVPKPSQCQIKKEIFDHDGHSVEIYWINYPRRKSQIISDILLLYFHGGGYMLGDIYSYSGFECHLSCLFNVTILHLEYRLCPEHPFPASVDDAVALYRALLRNNISPSQILIMRDLAGGGLSLLTIQTLITRQLSAPRGVIVLST
ncbi:unnamed protein product [Rotaria magnacalcarata]|uniref:Alpha/beta hydrolase fold-3 domain-containing protein n=2 Tax=Rotaria magnacalcarata TaxID=392030 RepID=A0A816C900_9BILA|nr:unnamed protein product [Rotaria magnacalcarata]CAF5042030.1 unnamed protein product [Rotaria magnacalcarata]